MFFVISCCGLFAVLLLLFWILKRLFAPSQFESIKPPDFRSAPFSVSDYYDRMEKESIKIQAEKAQQKACKLTLWAGLDGLQMNEDGSTQWIRRGEPERAVPVYQSAMNYAYHSATMPMQNMFNIQNQMLDLQSQNQALLLMQAQNMQNQGILSATRPYYAPHTPPCYYPYLNAQYYYNYRS